MSSSVAHPLHIPVRKMTRQSIATETVEFVEDMHLFCDRWCTRCGMTAKCRMAMAWPEDGFEPVQTADAATGLFQFLQVQFQKSARLWEARAAVCGDGPVPAARRSHEHPLFLDAQRYATLVNEWFHAEEPWFEGRHKALEVHALAGLPNATFAEAMLEIRGAAESLGWYQHDIAAKLQRAIEALESPIADSRDSTRSTVDGLAKGALVAIDRSIHAWLRLKRYRDDIPDSIFPLLVQLDHLRRAVDDLFPEARFFVRPGLDPSPSR
jgi:hypothetical protein